MGQLFDQCANVFDTPRGCVRAELDGGGVGAVTDTFPPFGFADRHTAVWENNSVEPDKALSGQRLAGGQVFLHGNLHFRFRKVIADLPRPCGFECGSVRI